MKRVLKSAVEMEWRVQGLNASYVVLFHSHDFLFIRPQDVLIRVGNRAYMYNNNVTLSPRVNENLWNVEVTAQTYINLLKIKEFSSYSGAG